MSIADRNAGQGARKLRLMVVDDSAFNRRNIAEIFTGHPDVEVVARASDGEEALRLATSLKPDVITLDLEMPRMDGFTFLRILMSRQPTPVVVVSSYSQKENVFKALELGAIDFVAKGDRQISPENAELRQAILDKVLLVRSLRPAAIEALARPVTSRRATPPPQGPFGDPVPASGGSSTTNTPLQRTPSTGLAPKQLVVIGCSTGGPSALLEVVGRLPQNSSAAFAIAQHMPDKFTRTFAERLGRRGTIRVTEAQEGDVLHAATGFVCPGRQCMEVVSVGHEWRLRVVSAAPTDRYVPSADRLFKSAAQAAGSRVLAVILTGMGDDGTEGAKAIRAAGGTVIVESQETAVVFGMPGAAVRAGVVNEILPLSQIADRLARLM
ncbi:MAG: chemotaxis response regulator protein-glutamate methylesterase [Polyangiales bacterium]